MKAIMRSTFSLLALLVALTCDAAPIQPASAPYRTPATGAGNSHSPVFSADGRHVAFVSHANNLATNDDLGPHLDLFVRDLVASNTVLVSISTSGVGGANDNVALYTLSSNAQFVAFETAASNLAPGDTNRFADIYVRDLIAGTTRLVSVNGSGAGSGNGPSSNPLISEDGRYIVFESLASNLVTNDFNGTNDIFIHDLTTGITELVSVNADGTASPDGPSHSPSISADGLTVAFVSHATNLVKGATAIYGATNVVPVATNRLGEVYARDVRSQSNIWVIASLSGNAPVSDPKISSNGRFVAFKLSALVKRFDLQRPAITVLALVTNFTPQGGSISGLLFNDNPRTCGSSDDTPFALSASGRFLMRGTATNAAPPRGLFLVDFETLVTNVTYNSAEGSHGPGSWSTNVVPAARLVVTNFSSFTAPTWTRTTWTHITANEERSYFLADATNLVAGVTNRTIQLYEISPSDASVRLVSNNRNGNPGPDLGDVAPSVSTDGSLVAWDSPDDNLIADDLNRAWDVFVRNVDTGETQLVSARHPDLPATSGFALNRLDPTLGAISANGRRIAVLSLDSTLAPNDTNSWRDLFVRDLITGTNYDVSRSIGRVGFLLQTNFPGTNTASSPSLSADGRFVAFSGESLFFSGSTNRTIYWRDLEAPTNRIVASGDQNNPAGVSMPVLSSNGRLLAFHSAGNHDYPFHPDGNAQSDVFVQLLTPHPPPANCQISLFERAPAFVSTAWGSMGTASGPSVNPAFSPDSAWVLFQSRATDLVSIPPLPPQSSYQLYARGVSITNVLKTGCDVSDDGLTYSPTKLISYSTTASTGPTGTSADLPLPGGGANPRFSADSRYVTFESFPNLIYRHDLLNDWVVMVMTHPEPFFPSFTNRARFTNDLVCSNCFNSTLSSEGRFIAYESVPVPGTAFRDVLVKDMQTGQTELTSVSMNGTSGNGTSSSPLISHDARYVVFASKASDLVANDTNRAADIFVRDRLAGVTHCVSRNWLGTGTGNRVSSNPVLAANGRTVAFQSFASDLVPGDYNDTRDVFILNLGGPDTDGDGMDDDWEMAYFSTVSRDGTADFDNDGSSDLDEFRAGTNPANDTSILRVLTLTTAPDTGGSGQRTTVLLWSAVPGRTYRVQFKSDVEAPWEELGSAVIAGGTTASKAHATDSDANRGFYRVLLVQ